MPGEKDRIVGGRLRSLRDSFGWNQEKVAKLLGIPRSTYSNLENSNRYFDLDLVDRAADLYDCSVDYLMGRTEDPTPPRKTVNAKKLLAKDLHWDGVPLTDKELGPIRQILELIVHERIIHRDDSKEGQN